MNKSIVASLCLGLGLSLTSFACGDDDVGDDDSAKVEVPGVSVEAEGLRNDQAAAGSAAK
ncbi:MAG: hypothetical protein ABW321_35255 [Polyangiales bacterium]